MDTHLPQADPANPSATHQADTQAATRHALTHHPRQWQHFSHVYPVISRRSGGLSIGINLNPDTACNFNCVYCCVPRPSPQPVIRFCLDTLAYELDAMLRLVVSGAIWQTEVFCNLSQRYRKMTDIAFSGDGEPTACQAFEQAVQCVSTLRKKHGLTTPDTLLITNATLLHRPGVLRAIDLLMQCNGVVWAKLDAGTQADYEAIDRSRVPLQRVLNNLKQFGQRHPLVLQTMAAELHGQAPSSAWLTNYCNTVRDLLADQAQITSILLYTISRQTAAPWAKPLEDAAMQQIATAMHQHLPQLPVKWFGSAGGQGDIKN